MKTGDSVLDIFVNKLVQKSGKILTREGILELWILSWWSRGRIAYAIQQGKNHGYIVPLMRDIFYVWAILGDEDDLYWRLVRVLIQKYAPAGAIIAWEKSMEYHLRNFSIPTVLILYTRDINKRVRLSGAREVHFRTLKSGEKKGGKNMFRLLEKYSTRAIIDATELDILGLEASILDAASLRIHEVGLSEELFEKFLRQYEKRLSRESLWELVSYRYIRAANRLRAFAKSRWFTLLYEQMLDVIKKEGWGCYLNL